MFDWKRNDDNAKIWKERKKSSCKVENIPKERYVHGEIIKGNGYDNGYSIYAGERFNSASNSEEESSGVSISIYF